MHLTCHQRGIWLRNIDGLFVAGRSLNENTVPVSKYAIDLIPTAERQENPCEEIDANDRFGINIYRGQGIPDGEYFSADGAMKGDFLFSLSGKAVEVYLNNLAADFFNHPVAKESQLA